MRVPADGKAGYQTFSSFPQNENPNFSARFSPNFMFTLFFFNFTESDVLCTVQMAKANNADTNHFLPSSPHHLNFERFRNLVNRAFYTRLQKTLRSTINLVL